ncbi:hypothetical protein V8C44DRAFT_262085 [Trichoderma aethiopicum]
MTRAPLIMLLHALRRSAAQGQSKLEPQADSGEPRVRSGCKRKWLGRTFELWQSRDISRESGARHGRSASHCGKLCGPVDAGMRDEAGIQRAWSLAFRRMLRYMAARMC